ncbi:MAG TPA: hypothetical protein VFE56_06125 [Candidatus Binataceae bacterium]|jgi:hypothetical protein|nr:hypothetical protein [Candidatus Binataceae bacterium]
MKHATGPALDEIASLLDKLRELPGLIEKSRGIFYRRGAAFVHFHEDPAGIFADLRSGPDWERLPATSAKQRKELLRRVRAVLTDRTV